MTDFIEATDIINNMVTEAWDTSNPLEYQDLRLANIPSAEQAWGRVSIQHDIFGQAGFGDGTAGKLYGREGTLTVQIFTPINDGMTTSQQIAVALINAFEGKKDSTGTIWFRKTYIREIGNSGGHFQTNFLTTFVYSHTK